MSPVNIFSVQSCKTFAYIFPAGQSFNVELTKVVLKVPAVMKSTLLSGLTHFFIVSSVDLAKERRERGCYQLIVWTVF